MTTPERFRTRQRFEGGLLLVLGLWVAFWTWNSSDNDSEIIECVETKVQELSEAAGERAELSTDETEATKKVLLAVPQIQTQEDFRALLDEYRISIEQVQAERKQNPLPPFPEGTCE